MKGKTAGRFRERKKKGKGNSERYCRPKEERSGGVGRAKKAGRRQTEQGKETTLADTVKGGGGAWHGAKGHVSHDQGGGCRRQRPRREGKNLAGEEGPQ